MEIRRRKSSHEKMMVPRFAEPSSFVTVDSTWGVIQPLRLHPGVETVAELEVIEHLKAGRPIVDTRHPEHHLEATLPGAANIPHEEIVERAGELDSESTIVLFCNGPQCKATPQAVEKLLGAEYPPEELLYYRGGVHDWMTLGLPIEGSRREAGSV